MQEVEAPSDVLEERGTSDGPDFVLLEKCAALIAGRQAGIDWRLILDAFADAVVAADGTHRILYINEAAEVLLGWPMESLVGQSLTAIIPPRLHASHNASFARYLVTRQPKLIGRPVRLPALRRDGTEVEVELSLASFRQEEGNVLFVAALRDLGDRVELERQLDISRYLRATNRAAARLAAQRELGPLLQSVTDTLVADFEAALARVWVYEGPTRTLRLRASAGLSTATVTSERAVIGLDTGSCVVTEAARLRQPLVIRDLASDPRFDREWATRERIKTLSVFPLVIAGELQGVLLTFFRQTLPDEAHEALATFAIVVAESARRSRAEAALRKSEERLKAILDNSGAVIHLKDPQGRYLLINRRYESLLHVTQNQVVGKTAYDLFPKDTAVKLLANDRAVLEAGAPMQFEEVVPHADGPHTYLSVKFPLYEADGTPYAVCAISTDISDRKRLEEELRRRADDLAAADRQKDQFLAMLAHELRNPLAPILNAVHALHLRASQAADDPALQRVRDVVERQARHMARLVDDLLDVSRISHGKVELRKAEVELAAVVRHAVQISRPLIEARGHHLTVIMPPEPLRLEADLDRLSQVITNLLNNAAKYTEPGGRIWLSGEREGAALVLRVRDSGVGIAAEMLPHVFELFRQVDDTPGRSLGGLGVGLSVVRSLVALHGGSVEAASDGPGQGSEFLVRLPLLPSGESAGEEPEGVKATRLAGQTLRLLVVDDNLDAAETLAELMQLQGHQVQVAHDGPAALTVARSFAPEVVLLDIGLPGMDGYEVARQLREQGMGTVLLVALTGYGQEEDRHRSEAAGFDHHLVKPVDLDQLEQLLIGWAIAR